MNIKNIDEDTIKELLNNYDLLSKYDMSTIVTIINNYCNYKWTVINYDG